MTKRFLVTGGAGFIGSAFVRHALAATEHHVLVVDKLTYAGNLELLAPVKDHPRFKFVRADIADAMAMRKTLADFQPDVVLHLAAESHVDRSIDGPAAFVQTNMSARSFSCSRRSDIGARCQRPTRSVSAFTMSRPVFGSLGRGLTNAPGRTTYESPLCPESDRQRPRRTMRPVARHV